MLIKYLTKNITENVCLSMLKNILWYKVRKTNWLDDSEIVYLYNLVLKESYLIL